MSYSDESSRVTGKSIAAFMFMPQFRMCFRGFSHLWPVFMRTLALVFAEAKLIASNHPALRYGERGVERTNIFDLFGNAWFTLRVTRADTYQWGMFSGIVLMLGMSAVVVGIFFMRVFFNAGTAAAQYYLPNMFEHPCDVYNGGACSTTAVYDTSIAGGTANISAPGSVLFDMRVQGSDGGATGISTDYALMVLDKILRQSMMGPSPTQNGGATQNALADLMIMYNTGMTLIAGIITLWMIMSIVVTTARAGVLGGGRTNMVWVPMRMVFALGIIFPLGTQGYSAGQYMVMKLAEWGSNLGTRGWIAYVQGVAGDATLLAPFSVKNVTSLVAGANKIAVCQIAYNAALLQDTGDLDTQQVVRVKQENNPNTNTIRNTYTNDTEGNLCGTISYAMPKGATTDDARNIAATTVTTPMDPVSAAAAASASRQLNTNFDAGLATAVNDFRNDMMTPLNGLFQENMDDGGGGTYGRAVNSGTVLTLSRQLACQIVGRTFEQLKTTGPNPVFQMGTVAGGNYNACPTAMASPIALPNATIPKQQLDRIMDAVMCQFDGSPPAPGSTSPACGVTAANSARAKLMNYITAPGGLVADLQKRGWAGMGRFYLDVAGLNSQVQGARQAMATVEPGSIWDGGAKGGAMASLKCAGRKMINQPCRKPNIEAVVSVSLGSYDQWWAEASLPGKPSESTANAGNATEYRNQDLMPSMAGDGDSIWSLIWSIVKGGTVKILEIVCGWIMPRGSDDLFFFNSIDLAATNTYPLAQLTKAGESILNWGLIVIAGLTVVQIAWSVKYGVNLVVVDASVSGNLGFAVSLVANILQTVSMAMILAGTMIAFYLPIIPLLRVAFGVLTWMFSVYEAIVMVPIAALAHLSAQNEGLAGGARPVWILWLNVLLRPILCVFGFVGAMLIFNSFAAYFQTIFSQGAYYTLAGSIDPVYVLLGRVAYSVIFMGVMYTAANTCFKLIDIFPQRFMRWMGGSPDHSMDDHSDGQMLAAARFMQGARLDLGPDGKKKAGPKEPGDPGTTKGKAAAT